MVRNTLNKLTQEITNCQICAKQLAHAPRPVVQINSKARILIAGQAPGRRVHESGIPFDDPSGDRLRSWMGIDKNEFYDATKIAILPMGFCYPGTGKSGDLAPRPECAEAWRQRVLDKLSQIQLTLVIGNYAQYWHLQTTKKMTLTDTVKAWRNYLPLAIPLPHPSPRNNIWLSKNAWFENEVIPYVKARIRKILVE